MELNPILTRESRARWRRRAFVLLFAGAALLALVMFFAYKSATYEWTTAGHRIQREASEVGSDVFQALTYYQVVAWMLLAPALTATAIASERERGLLEGLQLSFLTPGAIVRGKLFSALSFMALLMLSTLPIIATCFLLGGVSPGEFYVAALQIFLTALLGSAIGLAVSSYCRRASQSIGAAMGWVLVWSLGSYVLLVFAAIFGFRKWPMLSELCGYAILLNPVYTLATWQGVGRGALPAISPPLLEPAQFGWLMQATLSLLLLWFCTRAVRRPFDEQYWVEIGPATDVRDLVDSEISREKPAATVRATRALWQAPIAQRIKLQNPIMQRDLRAKFILRRVGPWAMGFQSLLLLSLGGLYMWLVWTAFMEGRAQETIWGIVAGGLLFGMMLAPALSGATSITREREAGTWEGIRLSLLSPWEIIGGKHIGAFSIAPLFCLALLPIAIACLISASKADGNSYFRTITLTQMLLTLLLIYSAAWMTAAWGMLISWFSRRTATATGWTIGSLFLIFILAPSLGAILLDNFGQGGREVQQFLWKLHPLDAFLKLFELNRDSPYLVLPWEPLRAALCYFAVGTALLLFLDARMKAHSTLDE
jgi:ABC-type transport system involved in multi-copper enzyme maturation permease subunit